MIKIGVVVKKLGLPASTIRYYEKVGLIKAVARVGNSRYFDENDVAQLKFIQLAQAVGFSIEEIKDLLTIFSAEGVDSDKCNQLVSEKITELDNKIQDLKRMQSALSQALGCDCPSLQACVGEIENIEQGHTGFC